MQKYCSFLAILSLAACSMLLAGCNGATTGQASATDKPAAASSGSTSVAATPVATTSAATTSVASSTAPIIRIKAGVEAPVKDSEGNVWQPEQGFVGGDTVARDDNLAVANTTDPILYRTEHYSMDSFSRVVPNGKYLVKLHFAETFDQITAAGGRVFSFNVQGQHEFKDFDVFVKAGGANRAYIESVPVDVTNGKIEIKFTSQVENPEINAIEIIPQS